MENHRYLTSTVGKTAIGEEFLYYEKTNRNVINMISDSPGKRLPFSSQSVENDNVLPARQDC
jgi:hypothetical protein